MRVMRYPAMNSILPTMAQDEERLGGLAMLFRGTRCDTKRRDIAKDYAQTVERLIQSGRWSMTISLTVRTFAVRLPS